MDYPSLNLQTSEAVLLIESINNFQFIRCLSDYGISIGCLDMFFWLERFFNWFICYVIGYFEYIKKQLQEDIATVLCL